MIYVIPISAYPKKRSLYIEKSNYIDLSNNSWTITRVYNGFFVRFWGDIPESYKIYACDYGLFKKANITNTGLLFVENNSFDTIHLPIKGNQLWMRAFNSRWIVS